MEIPGSLRFVLLVIVLVAVIAFVAPFVSNDYKRLQDAVTSSASILALLALVVYVFFTYKLAEAGNLPCASLELSQHSSNPYLVIPILQNHSRFSLQCWCRLNATVNAKPVSFPGFYGGVTSFDLQPLAIWHGNFKIEELLAKAGTTAHDLEQNVTQANFANQLRFKVEFWYRPLGWKKQYPNVSIPYYFDFRSKQLIGDF